MFKYYKIINAFLLIVLTIGLVQLYIKSVYPIYAYYGYSNEFEYNRFVFAFFIFFVALLSITLAPVSNFVYGVTLIFFIFSLIPNAILYSYMKTPEAVLVGVFLLIIFILTLSKIDFSIPMKQLYSKNTPRYMGIFSILLILPFFFVFGVNVSWGTFLLSGAEADIRLAARAIDNNYTGYVSNWLVSVICPVLLVLAVWKRKVGLFFIASVLMLYIFTCYGSKSVFLSLPLVLGLSLFEYRKKLVACMFVIVSCVFGMLYLIPGDETLSIVKGIFANRLFFVPALNNVFYFDFFEGRPIYLSSSILKGFGSYPYTDFPSFIIGSEYYDQVGMSANNGFPSDAYMNFGNIGVVIYAFLIAIIFACFNSLKLSHRFFGVFVLIIFNLIMAALTTTIITHGRFLFYILCLFFFRQSIDSSPNR